MTKESIASKPSVCNYACLVKEVTSLSADTFQFELQTPAGQALDFLAGQHLKLELDLEGEGQLQSLFYSIANSCDPVYPHRLLLFIQNSSAFSEKVIQHLSKLCIQSESVKVELPLGNTFLKTNLELPHLLIAAGSGITQIKALTEEIIRRAPDARVSIYWSNKCIEDFYLLSEFESWTAEYEKLTFTPILEAHDNDWQGRSGYIYEVVKEDWSDLDDVQTYLCGSPNMVYGTIDQLQPLGLKEKNCYSDVFDYSPREQEVAS